MLAVAFGRRVPAVVLPTIRPAGRQNDEDAVLPGLEPLVTAHAERSDHEALHACHDTPGRRADGRGKSVAFGHAPTKVVKVHVGAVARITHEPALPGRVAEPEEDLFRVGLRESHG